MYLPERKSVFAQYFDKKKALHEMLKHSFYSEAELIIQIQEIKLYLQHSVLDDKVFDQALLLKIAKELRPIYENMGKFKKSKEIENLYKNLSLKTKQLYSKEEIEHDWEYEKYSKNVYDDLINFFEKGSYLLTQLEDRFYTYMEENQVFLDHHPEYHLNWDKVYQKYQNRIIQVEMIECPIGEFMMGANEDQHLVKMNQKFEISATLVTQNLWKAVMKWNTSESTEGPNLPVENMTWYDCLIFCNHLSLLEGLQPCFLFSGIEQDGESIIKAKVEWKREANGYRLPTEAEWEYAAKANQDFLYSGSNDINEVAWYDDEENESTHPVKMKKPNAWGIYDMTGNVWEWCMDQYSGQIYQNRLGQNQEISNPVNLWDKEHHIPVLKGGSCYHEAQYCLNTNKFHTPAHLADGNQGFRLCKSNHSEFGISTLK
jgi:sulfatase modifying factor 1